MDQTASVLFSHFTSAALVVWLIQKLKAAPWLPKFNEASATWIKRAVSILGALGAHTGINAAWHSGGPLGGGAHQLIVNVPPLVLIVTALWRWAGQFVAQEGWYQLVYNRASQVEKLFAQIAQLKAALPSLPQPTGKA